MYLSIDFGKKRIGLALGEIIPAPAGVVDGTKDIDFVIESLKQICLKNEVSGIVIGVPMLQSGSFGCITVDIKEFANKLSEAVNLPIYFEEEQYTSVEAKSILDSYSMNYSRKTGEIDEMAAVLILDQFINRKKDEEIRPDIP